MRSILKTVFLLAFFLQSTTQLFAQTDSTRIRTTPEMRAESYEQFEQTSKKVEELNLKIIKYLDSVKKPKAGAYKKSYVASQTGWMNYRGGQCQIISDQVEHAPTGPDQFFYQCMADINSMRIEQLKELLINFKLEFGALEMK
jgi:uncharacterized protein YecT (DUF1311 family)